MTKTWTTKEGEEIKYKDLKDSHLLNILKWIETNAKKGMTIESGGGAWDIEDMWYDSFEIKGKEVEERYDYKGLKKQARKRNLL